MTPMATESQETASIVPDTGMGLYMHVPFCATKCPYCDFNTYQGIENLIPSYLEAVTDEMSLWGRVLSRPRVNTVFIGGGTPSYLPKNHLRRMLNAAESAFALAHDAEITAEANPDDLSADQCHALLSEGVNRLSIGVQSLDNKLLSLLGRRHDSSQATLSFQRARDAGFTNINLDLMYGLPHQSLSQWQDTLKRVVDLSPSHLSLYCLTLEEGTPLHRWVEEGKLPRTDEDLAADMYQFARELLGDGGYHHYEISNWARDFENSECQARHNLGYWRNLPYLGVGPGAHSRLGSYRFWDISSPRMYIDKVKRWKGDNPQPLAALSAESLNEALPVEGYEYIDTEAACAETMFLGLRLLDGLDLAEASLQAGEDLEAKYAPQIGELIELGLLERQDGRLRLASAAYFISNQVFTRFVR